MIRFRREQLKVIADWNRVRQGDKPEHMCPVEFTEAGMAKVLDHFKISLKPQDSWPKAAIVSRTNWPNQKLMTVLIDGKSHNVIVANARLFYPGAEVTIDRKGGNLICSQRPESAHKLFSTIQRKQHEEAIQQQQRKR
jgi:hypothetical protein